MLITIPSVLSKDDVAQVRAHLDAAMKAIAETGVLTGEPVALRIETV